MHGYNRFETDDVDPRLRREPPGRGARFGDPFSGAVRGRGGGRGRGRGRQDFFGFGRHGFGPGFGGPMFGRGPRVGRGDVRAAILALLAEEPMHGYQIITELTDRSGGVWRPSPGSVYPTLQAMEDQGLVTADTSEGRRVFSLTDEGREAAAAVAEGPAPWEDAARGADRSLVDLKSLIGEVLAALMQVGRAGATDQIKAAADVLTDTRRRIYLILADGTPDTEDDPASTTAGAPRDTTGGPSDS
jgi:DNA-binding PadR family transcriptional regulator